MGCIGAYSTIPARFGQVNEVAVAFVDVFQFELNVGKFSVIEGVSVL